MKRIDIIKKALNELLPGQMVTASELAEKLRLSRANVSSDLNILCSEGSVRKSGKKPVYYCLTTQNSLHIEITECEFDFFIQANPSLFNCGEQAKAAILYPPYGMHILLLGDTGVGKSMFAELIFKYALSKKVISGNAEFVSFNCADYANNPQLLMSHLFGSKKGAYTGADSERSGLFDYADGGILFLDEVHRLPPEGQEMLFTYIDRRKFRRLGETGCEHSANVLLICATTEEPDSSLLQTFLRRIPMVIKIPNLNERSLTERLNLISHFFMCESNRLSNPIYVTVNSMRALLGYTCLNNIGQLKTDIQLLCARAFSNYYNSNQSNIKITSQSMPPHIRNGLFVEKNRHEIWSILSNMQQRFLEFDSASNMNPISIPIEKNDIYQIIEQNTNDMRRIGMSENDISSEIETLLDDYYKKYCETSQIALDNNGIGRYVGSEIISAVDKIAKLIYREVGITLKDSIKYGLSLHINNTLTRIHHNQAIHNPQLDRIEKEFPEYFDTAKQSLQIIKEYFGVTLPLDEAGFIALFINNNQIDTCTKTIVQVIIVAHGNGIATGMAHTANQMLNANIVKGFDSALEDNPLVVYESIKEYLSEIYDLQEVFLLVDMGSLVDISYKIREEFGVRTKHFILASTLHAIEVGRKAILGYNLQEIYEHLKTVNQMVLNVNHMVSKKAASKVYILTVCTTGEGSAKVMREYLSSHLQLDDELCEIISLQITDKKHFLQSIDEIEEKGEIIAVVSSFQTNLRVQHFPLAEVLNGKAIPLLQQLLEKEMNFRRAAASIIPAMENLNDISTAYDVKNTIERIEKRLEISLTQDKLIGLFFHMCCILDRCLAKKAVNAFQDKQSFCKKYQREVDIIQNECNELGSLYSIEIPQDEACYIATVFIRNRIN